MTQTQARKFLAALFMVLTLALAAAALYQGLRFLAVANGVLFGVNFWLFTRQ